MNATRFSSGGPFQRFPEGVELLELGIAPLGVFVTVATATYIREFDVILVVIYSLIAIFGVAQALARALLVFEVELGPEALEFRGPLRSRQFPYTKIRKVVVTTFGAASTLTIGGEDSSIRIPLQRLPDGHHFLRAFVERIADCGSPAIYSRRSLFRAMKAALGREHARARVPDTVLPYLTALVTVAFPIAGLVLWFNGSTEMFVVLGATAIPLLAAAFAEYAALWRIHRVADFDKLELPGRDPDWERRLWRVCGICAVAGAFLSVAWLEFALS